MGTSPRGRTALQVSTIFTALAFIVVALRLYTRLFLVRLFHVEEYLIAFAMLCSIGLAACIGIQVEYGMGHHIVDLGPNDQPNSLKGFFASLIFYYLSLGLTKASIVLQYRRVFPLQSVQRTCWIVLAVVIGYTIWTVLGSIFACVPVRAFWTKEAGAQCLNQSAMWYTNAAINILTDFVIILLPMPVIKSLKLARRQKLALYIIFAIGGIVCIMSILRLQSLAVISNSADPTFDNPPAATWSSVETNVGIVCSCLPCLRPLVARYFPSVFASSRKSSGLPGNSRRRSRAAYLRHEPSTMLGDLQSHLETRIGGGDDGVVVGRDGTIQVLTQVTVKVERKDDTLDRHSTKELDMKAGASTDSLVKEPKSPI